MHMIPKVGEEDVMEMEVRPISIDSGVVERIKRGWQQQSTKWFDLQFAVY